MWIHEEIADLITTIEIENKIDDRYFQYLATSLATWQFEHNSALPAVAATWSRWESVPPLMQDVFTATRVASFTDKPETTYYSRSEPLSRFYVRDLAFHSKLVDRLFDYFVPPIADGLHLMAMPIEAHWRGSAMSAMFSRRIAGTPYDYPIRLGEHSFHYDIDKIIQHFDEACEAGQPTHIFTTTLGWQFILGALEMRRKNFVLPAGSCVVHTGGLKGRRSRVPLAGIPTSTAEMTGIPPWAVVSAYHINELPSVFFTPNYRMSLLSEQVPSIAVNLHQLPPWVRASKDSGRIALFDLGAMWNFCYVLTNDHGEVHRQFVSLTD